MKKYIAEFFGTMIFILMGCCAAVYHYYDVNTASVFGSAIAFGLAVVTMVYTIGGVSGCHINPAITLCDWITKRITRKGAIMYMIAQVLGTIVGMALLWLAIYNTAGLNTYQEGVSVIGILIAEIIITFAFIPGILASTYVGKLYGFIIGFGLGILCLLGLDYIGTSVNPALSIGTTLFPGGYNQLGFFTLGTYLGGGLATFVWVIIDDCYCEDNCEK